MGFVAELVIVTRPSDVTQGFFDASMQLGIFRFRLDHTISRFAGGLWDYFLCLRCNVFNQRDAFQFS